LFAAVPFASQASLRQKGNEAEDIFASLFRQIQSVCLVRGQVQFLPDRFIAYGLHGAKAFFFTQVLQKEKIITLFIGMGYVDRIDGGTDFFIIVL
jgi:hypothetical protein